MNTPGQTEPDAPLAGVRVVEVASVLAGPFAGHLLGLLGAEVIKVESPRHGDPLRVWGAPDGSGNVFGYINAGKKSVAVDLADPAAVERLRALLATADVVVTSGRPGALDRRGLGPRDLHAINPDLVVVSLTAFGDRGPLADRPGYDSVIQSITGLLHSYGVSSDVVSTTLPPLADLVAGLTVAQAALAGLVKVARGRGGSVFETSLYEAVSSLMGTTYARGGAKNDTRPQQSLIFQLRCAGGDLLTVHLSNNERFWRNLCKVVDPSLLDDPRFETYDARRAHYDVLRERLSAAMASRTATHWEEELATADVPAARVLAPSDALAEPQPRALDLLSPHGTWVGAPWRLDGRRPAFPEGVPSIGQDNDLLPDPAATRDESESTDQA